MNGNRAVLLMIGAVLLGMIITCMVVRANEPQADVQWEYKILRTSIKSNDTEYILSEYGKQGWEVVDWEDTGFTHFLLKRQL
jgi:hypothetical protein